MWLEEGKKGEEWVGVIGRKGKGREDSEGKRRSVLW